MLEAFDDGLIRARAPGLTWRLAELGAGCHASGLSWGVGLSPPSHDEGRGHEVRRAVLGDEHVNRSMQDTSDFNREFQDLITRYAWGEIWTRPGLPRHTRSLIVIATLVGLNRPEELRMHIRAAFNNGVTRDDIKEVLLQSAVYCGVPAANSAFHAAEEVFAEMSAKK
jgi:4-carboxymuconolactone decarboxylase